MDPQNTLYHYCSTDTFFSIIENKSIHLSSLKFSNDLKEGIMVEEIVKNILKGIDIDNDLYNKIIHTIRQYQLNYAGFGFCLSETGDLLSQWRGYADDASGISIGFNVNFINSLIDTTTINSSTIFKLIKIEYNSIKQINSIKHIIHDLISISEHQSSHEGINALRFAVESFSLVPYIYQFKPTGFEEEKEWRLIITDDQSTHEKNKYKRIKKHITPYREIKLIPDSKPIKEVIIGPKSSNNKEVIIQFLEFNGFNNISVKNSNLSYW